jgi:hypothetical protein
MTFPSSSSRTTNRIYARWVALILAVSLVAACALFLPIRREIIEVYDEGSYYVAARDIRQNGVLSKYGWADLHSYLYPTVLAYGIPFWLGVPKSAGRLSVFILQVVLFAVAALYIARSIHPALGIRRALTIVAMVLLNPFTLIYLGYSLTDSFSLTLTLAFVVTAAMSFRIGSSLSVTQACLTGLFLGGAMMTRPANIYLMGLAIPVFLLHLYQGIRSGHALRTIVACLVALFSVTAVCIPESLNRYRNFGEVSPLIISSGVGQFAAAHANIKYATYAGPGAPPWVNYRNPFYPPTEQDAPLAGYRKGLAWLQSTLSKMFGLVDQDFIRPYIYSFTTPDRWIGTVLSLSLTLAGVIGLSEQSWLAAKSLWESRFRRLRPDHALALCSLLAAGGCFALYSQTVVESRFGLPIVAIFALFAPFAVESWWKRDWRLKNLAAALFVLLIGAGCFFSHWLQSLSNSIVQAWG